MEAIKEEIPWTLEILYKDLFSCTDSVIIMPISCLRRRSSVSITDSCRRIKP